MPKYLLIILMSCFLIACAETKNSSVSAQNEYQILYGKTIRIDTHEITFLNITEDSRCPTNVQCIWKGRAIIQLEVDGILKTFYFGETRPGEPKSLEVIPAYTLQFLTPIPEAGKEIDSNSYRITLKRTSK